MPGPDGSLVETDVIEAGPVQPAQATGRPRPPTIGCSISADARIDAGTLGGFVRDATDGEMLLVTCNHVLSDPRDLRSLPELATIVQPGRLDGGISPDDTIGLGKRVAAIRTGTSNWRPPTNSIDAGVASLAEPSDRYERDAIRRYDTPRLGMRVKKLGLRTELTENGVVVSLNGQWLLNYATSPDPPRFAMVGHAHSVFNVASSDGFAFALRGDSGAIVFQSEAPDPLPAIGVLFSVGTSARNAAFGTLAGVCSMGNVFAHLQLASV